MANVITLGKGFTTIEDCEDVWDESVDGDVTASADGTDYVVGTASAKFIIAAGGSAGDIIATEVVNTNIKGTGLWAWVKCTVTLAAGDFQILLDNTANCASPHETLNIPAITTANQWQRVYMAFANPQLPGVLGTVVVSVGLKMVVDKTCTIWLDDILEGTTYVDYPILSVSGVSQPEGSEDFASQETPLLDGTIYQNTQYIRRVPVISTATLTPTQIQYVNDWWVASDQEILFEGEGVKVARAQPRFELIRNGNIRLAKRAVLPLRERRVWLGRPISWNYNLD